MSTHFKGPIVSENGFVGDIELPAALTPTTLSVGAGTVITKIIKQTASVVIPFTVAMEIGEATATVTGAAVGDTVIATPLEATIEDAFLLRGVCVSAANTVKIKFYVSSYNDLTGGTSNWQFVVFKS